MAVNFPEALNGAPLPGDSLLGFGQAALRAAREGGSIGSQVDVMNKNALTQRQQQFDNQAARSEFQHKQMKEESRRGGGPGHCRSGEP